MGTVTDYLATVDEARRPALARVVDGRRLEVPADDDGAIGLVEAKHGVHHPTLRLDPLARLEGMRLASDEAPLLGALRGRGTTLRELRSLGVAPTAVVDTRTGLGRPTGPGAR